MFIVKIPIQFWEIKEKHSNHYKNLVKIVVDVEKELVAVDAEMHADLEQLLLEEESVQQNLWGANLYFDKPGLIEFNSLINIRPGQGNMSMDLQDENLQLKVRGIVSKLILF